MDLILKEGKKTENEGTFSKEMSQQEKKETNLLKQIDEKLDLLLQAVKTGTE